MQLAQKADANALSKPPVRNLTLLIEPEPWLRIFLRNVADLFRPMPPSLWITSRPAEYWADAQVHRPVAWTAVRQSLLGHTLVILSVYALNLAWLNQPQVLPVVPTTKTILHYELSEYLPAINQHQVRQNPPRRQRPQKADPEFAPQEIVVINENHISTRQTIVHPAPVFLKQDIPMPDLAASTAVPGAPMAMNHPLQVLPINVPPVAAPAQASIQSSLRPLVFPPGMQPVVAEPASPVAAGRGMIRTIPLEGAIVVPPAPDAATRKADGLQLPAQSPPQVAEPSTEIAGDHPLQQLAMPAPQVAPPAPSAANRNLGTVGLLTQTAVAVPPSSPVTSGRNAHEKEIGQLLVLNAQPIAPDGPVILPSGNRPGEFAASPGGHSGATAHPEIKAGNSPSPAGNSMNGPSPDIYVSAPPGKVANGTVVSAPRAPRPLAPDRMDTLPRESIDSRVFGTRKHYSMRLSMPNLSSSVGSWSVRFAELNPSRGESDLSAPEAISKVDPAYPQDLRQDRIEGTVVLYAIIRSDGSVGEVRVLEGFDQRLDESARKALEQWRFRPGTKSGLPVDVEAVVRVPFKVPRSSF